MNICEETGGGGWGGGGVNFRQNRRTGFFRRNCGCLAEQKILGIPFGTIPRKRKMLGISYCKTKEEANSRNSLPNHLVEEKTTRNFVPWYKILFRSISRKKTCSQFCLLEQETFVLNHFLKKRQPKISKRVSEKTTFEISYFGCFVKFFSTE